MALSDNSDIFLCNEQIFQELYKINTIIEVTKKSCEEKEFSGQYYETSLDKTEKLSEERNNYINMLTIASDIVSSLMALNLRVEKILSDTIK